MAVYFWRIYRIAVFFGLLVLLLIVRLFYLQVLNGERLALMALEGRIQEIVLEVSRGDILDRNGVPLTNTLQQYSLLIFPDQVKNIGEVSELVESYTGVKAASVGRKIILEKRPFKLIANINADTAQQIDLANLPGLVAVSERLRYGTSMAAHVIGYINKADNKGVSGIECVYDEILRGSDPEYIAAMVDASQQVIPGLGYKKLRLENYSGLSNVVLTIDSGMQTVAESVFDANHISKGAAVIIKSHTGEILAMVSRPNFDANTLTRYFDDEASPLLNRAITAYQPGSVFKLVVAGAALDLGKTSPNEVFNDQGYIDVNELRFKGWDYEQGARGRITFTEAMAYSSNPVFIELALRVGADQIVSYAHKLGFGQKFGLGLPDESEGNVPSPDNMYAGEIANIAIGQGSLEATPLQFAAMVATIVNDGVKVEPYLVAKYMRGDGQTIKKYSAKRGTRVMSVKTAQQLQEMMKAVTNYGTGKAAYVSGFGSAGKTGSAETGRKDHNGNSVSHAWFVGYAPINNPEYVMVVFVEEGMSGGEVAAPIFREIMEKILIK